MSADCTALEARRGGARVRLGTHYASVDIGAVKVAWSRAAGQRGPDVVTFGEFGGSGGCLELFAVRFLASAATHQKLAYCGRAPAVQGGADGPRLEVSFGFLGPLMSNATAVDVPVPVRWAGDRFAVDLDALSTRSAGPEDLRLRQVVVRWSLSAAADESGRVEGDALQPALQSLAGLMLYGRAAEARDLLHAMWPRRDGGGQPASRPPLPGEAALWARLCKTFVGSPLWSEIGMDAIPQAELIHASAAD